MGRTRLYETAPTVPFTMRLSAEARNMLEYQAVRRNIPPAVLARRILQAGLEAMGCAVPDEGVHPPSDWGLAAKRRLRAKQAEGRTT